MYGYKIIICYYNHSNKKCNLCSKLHLKPIELQYALFYVNTNLLFIFCHNISTNINSNIIINTH